jgi:hypothetical protein
MAKPKKKMLDPTWQAARKADRHKGHRNISLHVDETTREAWLMAATAEGYASIPSWVQAVIARYIREEGSS